MQFDYQVKNQNGELINGKIDAPNEDQAVTILHRNGFIILSLDSSTKPFFSKDLLAIFSRVNKKDIVMFTRQLATLVDADVPLVEGLHALAEQVERPAFHRVVMTIASSIEGGASLSLALSEHEKYFGSFYISLVKSGEVAGKLHDTLLYMADYLERSAALNSKIKGAMAYPIFVIVAMIVVVFIMMTTVLPNLLVVVRESGSTDLPLTTRILIFATDFLNAYIWPVLLGIIALIVSSTMYVRSDKGRALWSKVMLQLPQFGKIIRNFYIARLGESLSTLIKAGVPILDGLNVTAQVVNNDVYKSIILEARDNVQSGGSISETFRKYKEFPPLVTSMLSIGERTGRTDSMLDNVTKFYKGETENAVQNLTGLIEPVLILFLGLGVGILVAAILLPIYNTISVG